MNIVELFPENSEVGIKAMTYAVGDFAFLVTYSNGEWVAEGHGMRLTFDTYRDMQEYFTQLEWIGEIDYVLHNH